MTAKPCATCYGAGEIVSEDGPRACGDCFGEGTQPSSGMRMEWRLRQIERAHLGSGGEREADIRWLVHELRKSRHLLVAIFAQCEDAGGDEALAKAIKYQINEALELYDVSTS
jgi:hypothetical protein